MIENPCPDVPVYKVRSSEHGDKPRVRNQSLLVPLLSVQKNKPEVDQEKSSMEQKDALCKGNLTCTEHDDISDDEISGTP